MRRTGRVPLTRELIVGGTPWIIVYRVRADVVEIIRVLHGAQSWPRSGDFGSGMASRGGRCARMGWRSSASAASRSPRR